MQNKTYFGQIATFAGAVLAFLIGSGFATGQEILQYFGSYGYQMFGVGIVIILVISFANYCFVQAGHTQKFNKGSQVFRYYCGPYIGLGFDYFAAIFCYMSFIVMLGGVGATVKQQFGISDLVGACIMALAAAGTVIFGLKTIVAVISKIGPLLVVISIIIGICSLVLSWQHIPEGAQLLKTKEVTVKQASTNWFFAGASYGGFCLMWLGGFMAKLGSENRLKELQIGQVLGVCMLVLACTIVGFAQLANIRAVAGFQIPNLILAQQLSPSLAHGFAIIIVLAIYTTACPLLWTVSARFTEEGSPRFKIFTAIIAALGCFVALEVPFDTLINYIYVINGYVGAFMVIFMIIKLVRMRMAGSMFPPEG